MLAAGSRALSLQLGGRNAQKAKMSQLTFTLQPTRQILTVSELTARIRDLLARNFTATFVQGEISNCREAQSGHLYFTLKDDRAQVRCVFFKQQQRGTRFRPEDGLQVTVRGTLSVYEQRGENQIDRKSTRLNSSHGYISYAVFCLKKKTHTLTRCIGH